MTFGGYGEKVLAGLSVMAIGALVTWLLRHRISSWWSRRRRYIVSGAGDTDRTFVSAGVGANGKPDLLVRNQNGEMRILVDPQPLGQVALRFIHPQTGGSLGHAIVLTAGELIDLRDRGGAAVRSTERYSVPIDASSAEIQEPLDLQTIASMGDAVGPRRAPIPDGTRM